MLQEELYNERNQEDETAAVRDHHMFHPNNLRLLFWMLESLEGCFGIPGFLAQEVIGIEIMRRRKTEGDVSTFCVCEIFLEGHCQQE